MASLYDTFPLTEDLCIVRRLEFHYTRKPGNMAEMEFSIFFRSVSGGVCRTGQFSVEGPKSWNWGETNLKRATTGTFASRASEPNYVASIASIHDLTVHWLAGC